MIENNPRSQACLAVASDWLRNCSENHASCNPLTESQKKPKRLVYIGDGSRDPYLVDTATIYKPIKWLSLSYCWGEEEPSVKLTRDTICMLRSGIAMDKLDLTIQDAIFVTRALDIPYIWIDSLCIIQDLGGAEWQEQADEMNEIYGGSTVTLVVASSKAVTEGFLKDRQPQYIPIPSRPDPTTPSEAYLSPEWYNNEDSADGPWSSRGWTMQEGLLPNRLLYYTSSQMIWKCCKEERFERGVRRSLDDIVARHCHRTGDLSFESTWFWDLEMFMKFKLFKDYLPTSPIEPLSPDQEKFLLWYELIEVYSLRRFRDISDRLVALSGLAKEFSSTIQCSEYIAGLWRQDLVRGLMWCTEGASLTPQLSSMRTANNIFPSWSWASAGYESIRIDQHTKYAHPISRVQEVNVELVDRCQPFGMVKSGRITIAGPLKQLPILYNKAWRSTDESMSRLERYISEKLEMESSGAVDLRYSSPPGGHFAVLKMLADDSSLDLLVLEATGGVTNGVYTYWRVGTLTLNLPLPILYRTEATSPDWIALFDKAKHSLKTRLGFPFEEPQPLRSVQGLREELKENPWDIQTVTLV